MAGSLFCGILYSYLWIRNKDVAAHETESESTYRLPVHRSQCSVVCYSVQTKKNAWPSKGICRSPCALAHVGSACAVPYRKEAPWRDRTQPARRERTSQQRASSRTHTTHEQEMQRRCCSLYGPKSAAIDGGQGLRSPGPKRCSVKVKPVFFAPL